jgi:hypothetical protein
MLRESIAFAYEMHLTALAEETAKDPVVELRKILEDRSSHFPDLREGRRRSDNEQDTAAGYTAGTDRRGVSTTAVTRLRATSVHTKSVQKS